MLMTVAMLFGVRLKEFKAASPRSRGQVHTLQLCWLTLRRPLGRLWWHPLQDTLSAGTVSLLGLRCWNPHPSRRGSNHPGGWPHLKWFVRWCCTLLISNCFIPWLLTQIIEWVAAVFQDICRRNWASIPSTGYNQDRSGLYLERIWASSNKLFWRKVQKTAVLL